MKININGGEDDAILYLSSIKNRNPRKDPPSPNPPRRRVLQSPDAFKNRLNRDFRPMKQYTKNQIFPTNQ
jgi:hypothetical protein